MNTVKDIRREADELGVFGSLCKSGNSMKTQQGICSPDDLSIDTVLENVVALCKSRKCVSVDLDELDNLRI